MRYDYTTPAGMNAPGAGQITHPTAATTQMRINKVDLDGAPLPALAVNDTITIDRTTWTATNVSPATSYVQLNVAPAGQILPAGTYDLGINIPPPYQLAGTFIVLSIDDANQVRMLTKPGHACAPVPLKNATLILPIELLSDPEHEVHHEFLKTLPTRADVWSNEIGDGAKYPVEVQACTYDSSWPEGEPVVVGLPTSMR
jgi:hypothetical protein